MADKLVLTNESTDAELIDFARAAMKASPNGNPNPRRTDAPLRSAYDPAYLEEKAAADAAAALKPEEPSI